MISYKQPDLTERQGRSANARQKLLDRFREKSAANDPAAAARLAERQAVRSARTERDESRRAASAAAAAEQVRAEAAARAEQAETERLSKAAAVDPVALAAAQKTARDVRYAARKARKS
jgi:hypothetical protein